MYIYRSHKHQVGDIVAVIAPSGLPRLMEICRVGESVIYGPGQDQADLLSCEIMTVLGQERCGKCGRRLPRTNNKKFCKACRRLRNSQLSAAWRAKGAA